MNEWKGQLQNGLEAAIKSNILYLFGQRNFRKSQGILKSYACGNND